MQLFGKKDSIFFMESANAYFSLFLSKQELLQEKLKQEEHPLPTYLEYLLHSYIHPQQME
jgi:hypothetical protein|tara:strand:+ start:49 stop:228 length:180 start_codon:yes stop_codon:yes gene_type:complete